MSKEVSQVIDPQKLQKLADVLNCTLDDIFAWTDLGPLEFINQVADTAGFDVELFLKTDINKLDFENIATKKGLLKKFFSLPERDRSIKTPSVFSF